MKLIRFAILTSLIEALFSTCQSVWLRRIYTLEASMSLLSKLFFPFVRNVQKSASDYGGHCTWQFSQMRDPVASIIATNPGSADGICEMLSAKWLEGHANDAHIANWIMSGDAIDASKVRYLMQLFLIGTTMNRSAIIGHAVRGGTIDQDEASKRWLAAKGIIRRNGVIPMTFMDGSTQSIGLGAVKGNTGRAGANRSIHAGNLANAIARDLYNGNGHYVMIGIYGPGGGHAMAAWIANDVAFFDPNFGEFYFANKADFIRWLPTYFKKSLYCLPKVGLCERYETFVYSKRV
ncbi:YopT-type cysteine protease domain-containing protein [Planktotalea frisia]|nr:YopT-type cysteine protease domain-containing protein [Planktotalea frisia]